MKVKIYNQRMAGYLLLSGFALVLVGENEVKPEFYTFYFDNSEKLQAAIEYYKANKYDIIDTGFNQIINNPHVLTDK